MYDISVQNTASFPHFDTHLNMADRLHQELLAVAPSLELVRVAVCNVHVYAQVLLSLMCVLLLDRVAQQTQSQLRELAWKTKEVLLIALLHEVRHIRYASCQSAAYTDACHAPYQLARIVNRRSRCAAALCARPQARSTHREAREQVRTTTGAPLTFVHSPHSRHCNGS